MIARRGFTLLELAMGLFVAALAIAAAAKLSRFTMTRSGQSQQQTEVTTRARLIGTQLRVDLDLAGYGSTGAIGANCPAAFWAPFCVSTARGIQAIPAVRQGDNIGAGPALAGTDVLQVVVPDPSTRQLTTQPSRSGTLLLFSPPQAPTCNFAYVADHSAPNGAGRTQILQLQRPSGLPMEALVADVATGSEVMCGRISTYWIDVDNVLRRSDLDPAAASFMANGVTITPAIAAGDDFMTPGVEDMQIASAFSSAVPGSTNVNRWAYDLVDALGGTIAGTPRYWFEARQIRFNILLRSFRRLERTTRLQQPQLENGTTSINLDIAYGRHLVAGSGELANLRLFDENAAPNTNPEPY